LNGSPDKSWSTGKMRSSIGGISSSATKARHFATQERERTKRGADFHATATTSCHVLIAAARSTRCD
jgi:hypothetical protein